MSRLDSRLLTPKKIMYLIDLGIARLNRWALSELRQRNIKNEFYNKWKGRRNGINKNN